jgi:L-threonylcarbamoyladenylate synthase
MIVLNMDEMNVHRKAILKELKKSVFVYPTDTIYGVGCNANEEKMVSKIRKLKGSAHPFSVIVPNKEWIYNNCEVTEEAEEWIRKLPGPYTLIMRLKNPKAVAKNVYNNVNMTLGIRIPNHWFANIVNELRFPIVTTAANLNGNDFMTSLSDLDPLIRNNVDYVFYEGEKRGSPSTIVNLVGPEVSLKSRASVQIKFPLKEISVE